MKHVYTARDEMEAHFVRGLLEQQGIEADVQGETLQSGAYGTLPLSSQATPSVWVEDAQEQRAGEIIEEYRQVDRANAQAGATDKPRATWSCPNCGERVEEQFTQCWKCGHNRPEGTAASAK